MAADLKEDLKQSLTALGVLGAGVALAFLAPELPAGLEPPKWYQDGVSILFVLYGFGWLLAKYAKWVWRRLRGVKGAPPA